MISDSWAASCSKLIASSEAAGVNSAAGSFGLSFGLAMAGGIMLAALSLSFTRMVDNSDVIPPAQQQQITAALQTDAEVMSNTELDKRITGQPPQIEEQILAINNDARNRSLQVALLVPLPGRVAGAGELVPYDPPARPQTGRPA